MDDVTVSVIATLACVTVWVLVVRKAVREKVSLVLLALVLIVLGLMAAGLLVPFGVPVPGAWTIMGAGIALLILWPRHEGVHTCSVCGRPHLIFPDDVTE